MVYPKKSVGSALLLNQSDPRSLFWPFKQKQAKG